ncbi:radical SAM protein [Thermosipho ferrireducens]|uniref:Radical SAM protein n=1 Tax=Thermosipho ferrireducens TaxID=2571116 RepID=A0ABX7S8R5_9BACT|nr:radical SAM protein [Thermosipho ferrireducens]QTA38012.1 radical SAM protein [Thermosipho ferrireducens]
MIEYKESKYNVWFEEGEKVVFVNYLTRAIATVNKDRAKMIKEILENPNKNWNGEYKKLKEDLIYGGYLVNKYFDELQHLKMMNYISRYDTSSPIFTIMPTLQCNFDCVYCYESKEGPSMRYEIAERIVDYLCEIARKKRKISIGWFGGEPLISFEIIRYINERVAKVCEEYNSEFHSSMSTNGFLLSEDKARYFDELKIRNVQITLDGPPEYHNKYRPLKGGAETFDKIYNNMKKLLEVTETTQISLRVNVGVENYDHIPQLLDMFDEFPKERMRIYFRWIFQGGEDKNGFYKKLHEFKGLNSFKKISKFYVKAAEKGFKVFFPILTQSRYCEYDSVAATVIGPEGEVYPCTVAVMKGSEFGKVTENGIEYEKEKYLYWYKPDAFEDEECKSCKILPICMGGCRNAKMGGNKGCPEEKRDMEHFAKVWYFTKKLEKSCGVEK